MPPKFGSWSDLYTLAAFLVECAGSVDLRSSMWFLLLTEQKITTLCQRTEPKS